MFVCTTVKEGTQLFACVKIEISSGTDDEDSDELGEADWDAIFANEEGEFMNNLNQGKIESFEIP